MKPVLTLCVLSTLILSACSEESTSRIQNDPEPPVIPGLDTIGSDIPGPDIPGPITPGAGTVSAALINGNDLQSIDSFWSCQDPSDPGVPTELAFFSSGQMILVEGDVEEYMEWELEGGAVNLFLDSQFFVKLSDFRWSAGNQQFASVYAFYDGSSGNLNCEKMFLSDDAPDESTNPGGGDVSPGEQAYILNSVQNGELADMWACETSSGDSLWFAFLAEGQGGLLEENYYPDGIDFTWNFRGDDVVMTLVDGNQAQLSNVVVDSYYLDSDSLVMNGGQVGSLACDRESI